MDEGLGSRQAKGGRAGGPIGIVQGETVAQMTRRIVGTRRLNYADGVVELSRRSAETLVRTAATHVTPGRGADVDANKNLIGGVVWVSTLNSRMRIECAGRRPGVRDRGRTKTPAPSRVQVHGGAPHVDLAADGHPR